MPPAISTARPTVAAFTTCGTVFELTPNSGRRLDGDGAASASATARTGASPDGQPDLGCRRQSLRHDFIGGIHDDGTVFELTPKGSGGWTEKRLYSFDYGSRTRRSPMPA